MIYTLTNERRRLLRTLADRMRPLFPNDISADVYGVRYADHGTRQMSDIEIRNAITDGPMQKIIFVRGRAKSIESNDYLRDRLEVDRLNSRETVLNESN